LNTAISSMMILVNKLCEQEKIGQDTFAGLLKVLSPFAPFLSEELWLTLGEKESIFKQTWPEYNADLARDENIKLIVQVNGKLRDTIEVSADISEEDAKNTALESEKVQKWIEGKEVLKVIFAKGKIVSIVVKEESRLVGM